MLVKRHVFEKLDNHPAVKPFNNDIGLPKELDQHLKTYYDTAVRENRYYSEDWTFCENWRDLGGKVWVDKRVLLKHTGTYVFDYNTQSALLEGLKGWEQEQIAQQQALQALQAQQPQKPADEPVIVAESKPAKANAVSKPAKASTVNSKGKKTKTA
jgi:hypothetical protein